MKDNFSEYQKYYDKSANIGENEMLLIALKNS